MRNSITQAHIDEMFDKAIFEYESFFGKCTIVTVQLDNGFVITESSACVDPANYNEKIGIDICIERIKNKLWELEGYALQKELYTNRIISELEEKLKYYHGGKENE